MLVGIETDRGLWVQALLAAGYRVFVVNPLTVSRYRQLHHLSGAKSDPADAETLADMVRTYRHQLRPATGDTELAAGINMLARTHQTLIWERTRHTNRLRSTLREYYPSALAAFTDLDHPDTLAVLDKAPTPAQGAALTITQITAALKKRGPATQPGTTSQRDPNPPTNPPTRRIHHSRGRVRGNHQSHRGDHRRVQHPNRCARNRTRYPF